MGRLFSLRGTARVADNAIGTESLLIDYVSPDRQRAWKIEAAWLWPVEARGDMAADNVGQMVVQACLHTDTITFPNFDALNNPADNRLCGWYQQQYMQRSDSAVFDFIVANGTSLADNRFLIDPDTMVTKELYLSLSSTRDGTTSPDRLWGWMVLLREMKVSPAESLFAQIKGMGQDVTV
jgi:hypothetical protein